MRVIEWEGDPQKAHTMSEIRGRFWAATNRRMDMDRNLVCSRLTGRKPKKALVLETWKDVLAGAQDLPQDWIDMPGVLVGTLGQPRPSGVG